MELIAGALAYSKYNWLVRFVMRSIAKKEGGDIDTARDYEYTDWEGVDRFAVDFVNASAAGANTGASTPAELQGVPQRAAAADLPRTGPRASASVRD